MLRWAGEGFEFPLLLLPSAPAKPSTGLFLASSAPSWQPGAWAGEETPSSQEPQQIPALGEGCGEHGMPREITHCQRDECTELQQGGCEAKSGLLQFPTVHIPPLCAVFT